MSKIGRKIDTKSRQNRYKVTDEKLERLLQQSIAEVQAFHETEVVVAYLLPCGVIIFGRLANANLEEKLDLGTAKEFCRQDALNQLRLLESYRARHQKYVDSQESEKATGVPKPLSNSQIEALLENAIAQTRYCHNRGVLVSYLLPCGYTITGMSRVGFTSFDTMDAVHKCYVDAAAQLRELEDYRLSWDIYLYHLRKNFQVIEDAGRNRMRQNLLGMDGDAITKQEVGSQ